MGEEIDNSSLYSIHQSVVQEQMEFLYKGHISDEIINVLLEIIKKKFKQFKIDYSLRKKIYNIGVECLENIRDHAVNQSEKDSIFIIGTSDDIFYLGTGNVIDKNISNDIVSNLEKINSLDKEGLKELYKSVIKSELSSNGNDVGLGLIDIAIKANNKINYEISPVNDAHDFLSFQVKINTKV